MAVTAYVLIQTEVGKAAYVAQQVRGHRRRGVGRGRHRPLRRDRAHPGRLGRRPRPHGGEPHPAHRGDHPDRDVPRREPLRAPDRLPGSSGPPRVRSVERAPGPQGGDLLVVEPPRRQRRVGVLAGDGGGTLHGGRCPAEAGHGTGLDHALDLDEGPALRVVGMRCAPPTGESTGAPQASVPGEGVGPLVAGPRSGRSPRTALSSRATGRGRSGRGARRPRARAPRAARRRTAARWRPTANHLPSRRVVHLVERRARVEDVDAASFGPQAESGGRRRSSS